MKKNLAIILLAGLMLTGCGGTAKPAATATAVAVADETVTVPGVVGLTLDKAKDQLKELGLDVESEDMVEGKSIFVAANWLVISQDPAKGSQVTKDSPVHLGVKSLEKVEAEKEAASAAAAKTAANKAAVQKAAQPAAPAPVVSAPAPVAPAPPAPAAPAPAAVYYENCAAARAAGAAPVYAGTPGYGTHLDRDRDGIGCDK